ncbi:hypothetical protein QBC34DRAFT_478759 [Podospora aff. communis PSN243]|uniref:Ecp2 effector protein domain-containing protein n=1 Tax=Podospora aff. communis PSN243 TaxID=3040156 RepID=A0AAV9G697_9PEZI|nr:hypothetical protein QBC34DRAFT_478759 [Podospora aff. communis PSN243]
MLKPTLFLSILPSALAAAPLTGHIYALLYPNINLPSSSSLNSIGCLNALGQLTLSDCAVFSHTPSGYGTLSTAAGNCTFNDKKAPENADSLFKGYAWTCGEHLEVEEKENYYLGPVENWTDEFKLLGNGNLRFFYDVPALPATEEDKIPVWRYLWGSAQVGVPEEHHRIGLLWVKTEKKGV